MGNSARVRAKNGSQRPRDGNTKKRSRRKRPPREEFPDDEDIESITAEELELTKSAMNLSELKNMPASELVELAQSMGLENLARSRKQDIIFSILKEHAKAGESSSAKESWRFFRMDSASYALRTAPISPARTTSMFRRVKFGVSACARVIRSRALSARRRTVSVILRFSRSGRSIMTRPRKPRARFYSRI